MPPKKKPKKLTAPKTLRSSPRLQAPSKKAASQSITAKQARAIWLKSQGLHEKSSFGEGADATAKAVEHVGCVQIDTINVIERSHHHILFTRIPGYRREDLEAAQSVQKSIFEYWAHALSYIGTADYEFFVPAMDEFRADPKRSSSGDGLKEYFALLRRIKKDGPLSIRDIDDEVKIEKAHPWGSRKPSRTLLRYGFFVGDLTVSKRTGMLKTYDLTDHHFGWPRRPKPATKHQFAAYLLRRAVRSQGIVSLDSVCYGNIGVKPEVKALIESDVQDGKLIPVHIEDQAKIQHWLSPDILDTTNKVDARPLAYILSPFDPLVIQRKRLELFFNYQHRFEAYLPAAKRIFGYFALPILVGDEIVAAVDLKADRREQKLIVQKWTWTVKRRSGLKATIDEALNSFERFQFS